MSANVTPRSVVVTGASGRMGSYVASALLRAGYRVVGLDRGARVGDDEVRVEACDVTNADDVRAILTEVNNDAPLYGVVNCAALIPTSTIADLDEASFLRTISVNTWGTFNVSREAARIMGEHGQGRIVNVASVAGYIGGLVGGPDYAASKAGVMVLTKMLAKEYSGQGITVNTVAPGALDSPATDALDDSARDALLEKIPAHRFGTVHEIAHSIIHLLSPDSGYITGATIDVNGGVHLR